MSKNNPKVSQRTAYCPSCDGTVSVYAKARLGQKLTCKSCRTELEIVELNPLTLDWAFDYEDTADNPYSDYDDNYDYYSDPQGW